MRDNFGFILSRHVTSEATNRYWNQAVRLIRTFYPLKKIVIIDDNSNWDYIKPDFPYKNLEIVRSEYPGRGELLPYYYFYKYHWFDNAVIIHDSVFFHARIPFEKYIASGTKVMPFWHFNPDKENFVNSIRIATAMKNNLDVKRHLTGYDINILGLTKTQWFGCFGVQSFINHTFLSYIQNKYGIFQMLSHVKCRLDRCCLERIMGVIFYSEAPQLLKNKTPSIFGNIFNYCRWGYTYDEYISNGKAGVVAKPVVKVWTGR